MPAVSRLVSAAEIDVAVRQLRAGRLVAFPTETVYGLGADASKPEAVSRIFAAKGRPATHPVIVHLGDPKQLDEWAIDIPRAARALVTAFWPGPLTLVLLRAAHVSDLVTGGQATVGLRCPSHSVARALLAAFGGALAAPSANRYGHISPTRAQHVRDEFPSEDIVILDGGDTPLGIESTIVGFDNGQPCILRPGSISAAQIASIAGAPVVAASRGGPRVPGSVARHYAPRTPTELVPPALLTARVAQLQNQGLSVAVLDCADRSEAGAEAYAQQLYARLRALDASGAARILIEAVPETPAWAAVRDRASRAAS